MRNLEEAKVFFLLWLTNWERPQDKITREESFALNMRVIDSIISWKITPEKIAQARQQAKTM